MIAYACITNMLLMTLYSMNNMPYAALGGVITSDLKERTELNAYRFTASTNRAVHGWWPDPALGRKICRG